MKASMPPPSHSPHLVAKDIREALLEGRDFRSDETDHLKSCIECQTMVKMMRELLHWAFNSDSEHRAHSATISVEVLEQWLAGTLSTENVDQVTEVVEQCAVCQAQLRLLKSEFSDWGLNVKRWLESLNMTDSETPLESAWVPLSIESRSKTHVKKKEVQKMHANGAMVNASAAGAAIDFSRGQRRPIASGSRQPGPSRPEKPQRSEFRNFTRGAIWFMLDPLFSSVLALSAGVHLVLVFYAASLPPPPNITLEELPDEFAKLIIPSKETKPEIVSKTKIEVEAKKEPDEKQDAKKEFLPEPIKPSIQQQTQERREKLRQVGILKVLGSKYGSGSAVGDIVGASEDSGGLAKLLDSKATGMTVASTQGSGDLRSDEDGMNLVGVGDVGHVGRDEKVALQARKGKGVKIQVDLPSEVVGGGDKATVQEVIKKNAGGLQSCYDTALKLNPTLAGKFYIDFTIEETGRVSRVALRSTVAPDAGLEQCLRVKVSRWQFPAAEEGATDVSVPVLLAPQN